MWNAHAESTPTVPTVSTKSKCHDYRMKLIREQDRVRLISRGVTIGSGTSPLIVAAALNRRQKSFVLDGDVRPASLAVEESGRSRDRGLLAKSPAGKARGARSFRTERKGVRLRDGCLASRYAQ
jgi:hypothetical protein